MSRSLIDPFEDPKVHDDGSIVDEKAPEKDKPSADDELLSWAEKKGFGKNVDPKFLEAYRNLEQDHGRLRNEVGESRQLMDRVIRLEEERQHAAAPQEEEFNLDPTDLLANPKATLDTYFEKRIAKEREQYESRISQLEGQLGQQSLSQRHSDADQLVNDPAFIAYVQASPIRMRTAQQAVAGDLDALDDLLTDYKASQPREEKVDTVVDPGRAALENARRAGLESSASSGGDGSSNKIFSRAAIIRKKIEDPDGYADPFYQEQIKQAYIDGRVR